MATTLLPDTETRSLIRRQLVRMHERGVAPDRLLALAKRFEQQAARLAAEARWIRQQVRAIYDSSGGAM